MLHVRVPKILKKFIMVSPLRKNSFDIFVIALQKHFVYDLSLKVMTLAQNRPKAAKSFKGMQACQFFSLVLYKITLLFYVSIFCCLPNVESSYSLLLQNPCRSYQLCSFSCLLDSWYTPGYEKVELIGF